MTTIISTPTSTILSHAPDQFGRRYTVRFEPTGSLNGHGSFEMACVDARLSAEQPGQVILHPELTDQDAGRLLGLIGFERFDRIARANGWKRITD